MIQRFGRPGLLGTIADRVTQLAELKAQGVVSEEEFAAEKARILNS